MNYEINNKLTYPKSEIVNRKSQISIGRIPRMKSIYVPTQFGGEISEIPKNRLIHFFFGHFSGATHRNRPTNLLQTLKRLINNTLINFYLFIHVGFGSCFVGFGHVFVGFSPSFVGFGLQKRQISGFCPMWVCGFVGRVGRVFGLRWPRKKKLCKNRF